MSKFTEADWMEIVAVTHAGMSTEAFQALVRDWLAKAKDRRFHRPYTDLVYQPMLEVMRYLRSTASGHISLRAEDRNLSVYTVSACTVSLRNR